MRQAQKELHPESDLSDVDRLSIALKMAQKDAYGHPEAYRAKDIYEGQNLSGLELYHGSPHVFAPTERNPLGEFDFLEHMGKGEGAQIFGPGSYLTGNTPLAWHYATSLTRSGRAPPAAWVAGYKHDPDGFMELLRARALLKARGYDITPGANNWMYTPGGDRITSYAGLSAGVPYDDLPRISIPDRLSRVDLKNAEHYTDVLNSLYDSSPLRVKMRSEDSGKRGADLGRQLIDKGVRAEGAPYLQQKKISGVQLPEAPKWSGPLNREDYVAAQAKYRSEFAKLKKEVVEKFGLGAQVSQGPVNVTRNNLRAVQAATEGLPGTAKAPKFRRSMNQTMDLKLLENAEAARRANLYTARTPTPPSELFSYDWPLEVTSPRVADALGVLARKHGVADSGLLDMKGEAYIKSLRNKLGSKKTVEELRQAGVPGMYFLRAGQRDATAPPPQFNPDDYNFVWFDDPMLDIKKREQRAQGGSV